MLKMIRIVTIIRSYEKSASACLVLYYLAKSEVKKTIQCYLWFYVTCLILLFLF